MKEFESENDDCIMDARSFLEMMLCDMHVSYTHYYILEYLYNMFVPLIDFVSKGKIGTKETYMSGNYDGTNIRVVIQQK